MSVYLKRIHADLLRTGTSMTAQQMLTSYGNPSSGDLDALLDQSNLFRTCGNGAARRYFALPDTPEHEGDGFKAAEKLGRVRSVWEIANAR